MLRRLNLYRLSKLGVTLTAVMLAGCSQLPWQGPLDSMQATGAAQPFKSDPADIDFVASADPRHYRLLSIVTGDSCQKRLDQPPASNQQARQSMRLDAARFGAQAIIQSQCYPLPGTASSTCYTQISCTGKAVTHADSDKR